jgi:hypothetical protein
MRTTKYKELLILLNKVWGLEGFHSFLALRINRRARLGFGGTTVLVVRSG